MLAPQWQQDTQLSGEAHSRMKQDKIENFKSPFPQKGISDTGCSWRPEYKEERLLNGQGTHIQNPNSMPWDGSWKLWVCFCTAVGRGILHYSDHTLPSGPKAVKDGRYGTCQNNVHQQLQEQGSTVIPQAKEPSGVAPVLARRSERSMVCQHKPQEIQIFSILCIWQNLISWPEGGQGRICRENLSQSSYWP